MAYSHLRLRKTLAVARVICGAAFVVLGLGKISSIDFAWNIFPQFLGAATHGGAAGWYGDFLKMISPEYAGKLAVFIGFSELGAGIALVLGIGVRLVGLIGVVYMLNLLLATWNMAGLRVGFWQQIEGQMGHLMSGVLLFMLAIGHAGETWGLAALYHRRRPAEWADERRYRAERFDDDFDDEFREREMEDVREV